RARSRQASCPVAPDPYLGHRDNAARGSSWAPPHKGGDTRLPTEETRSTALKHLRTVFADEAFDVIVSNSTLDHFGSWAELGASLHELHRVLKTRGLLIITLDNRANPIVALRNAA